MLVISIPSFPTIFSIGFFLRFLTYLTKNKTEHLTKLKAFADDKIQVFQVMISVLQRVENILGKRENAGFQKGSLARSLKVGIVW